MPIDPLALRALENSFLRLPREMSLREAFRHLVAPDLDGQPWWHLVVSLGNGSWATATFAHLYDRAQEDPRLLDLPLQDLDALLPATVVDQENIGTAGARRLARSSPGSLVVVTRDGNQVGILCAPMHSGGTASKEAIRRLASQPPAKGSRQSVCRFTDVSCPDQVALETQRFSVVVRLTLERSSYDASTQALENLAMEKPVQVDLQAPDFELLNGRTQEIWLLPHQDSAPAVFDLRPRRIGDHRLELEFFQETTHLGMASIPVRVTEVPTPWRSVEGFLDLPVFHPGIPPPDLTLRILWSRDSLGPSLHFTLLRQGGAGWDDFPPVRLAEDLAEYAKRLFSRLAHLAAGATPAEEIQRELRIKGQNLWELLPPEFRALYAEERAGWRAQSLLIVSDEPQIPWELIWPWDYDWQDAAPWCATLRLSRWLRRDALGNGNSGAPGLLPLRSLACLAAGEIGLPSALAERDFLQTLAARHGIQISPPAFTRSAVTTLLENGGYDWLHLATHGSFSDEAPNEGGGLRLEDLTHLTPETFVGSAIARHLRQQRPAFVLNACETARQAWGLVGLGGWANRLISLGAGMFLGTLWPVNDVSALSFAKAFYPRLLAGEAVAEALRQARLKIHEQNPKDPAWLAYSLYSHPNARVTSSIFRATDRVPA